MRVLSLALVLLSSVCVWAGEPTAADKLLDEQLGLLTNKDIRSTIRILRKVNKFFLIEHKEATPAPTPTDAQTKAGYILFTRNYLEEVYYNTHPRPSEIKTDLRLFATPGEYEPVTFAVLPLDDLKDIAVTCSALASANGAAIPKDAVDVRFTRQLARGTQSFMWMVGPEAIENFTAVDAPKGRTTQFWLTVRAPDKTPPGEYKGTVAFRPANKPATELKLSVVVLPFRLLEDPNMAFGWYYGPGRPESVRRELADIRAHGNTTITIPAPKILSLTRDGKASVDFGVWENYRKMCAEVGLNGIKQTDVGHITGAIVAQGIKELGPGFDVPFVGALKEHKRWLDDSPDFRVVFCIYDEPRESLLNSWNRTYDQTVAYIKLCRQVPGLLTTVNPMGDGSDRKDYTPLAEMVDILNSHSWHGSAKLIALTKKAGKTLWVYNNGYSRLAWGFSVWKIGAQGNWQWMYPGWNGGSDAYCPIPIGGFENEGSSNTGCFPIYAFKDRLVPTPRYEWTREGIDDYKYLYTLLARLKSTKLEETSEAVATANKLLKEIDRVVPEYPESGLKSGADAGASGDPVRLLAYYDHFRWRMALAILALDDAAKGKKATDADSLTAAFSRFKFGELPAGNVGSAGFSPLVRPEGRTTNAEAAIQVEATKLSPGAKLLFDFEDDACFKQIETDAIGDEPFDPDVMPAKRVKRAATHGEFALFYEPTPKGGGLHLINFDGDWKGFDFLRIDFYNPNDKPITGSICITDTTTKLPENRPRAMGFYQDRFDTETGFAIPPGKFTYELRLGGLSANNGRALDLSKIRKIAIGCGANNVPFYLDCIRLEKE